LLWKNNATSKEQSSTDKGNITERFAEQYLTKHGLTFVESNYHSRQGEIDLIMRDGETYVFIEVKYRKNMNFGGAIAAIPISKQKKIRHCITFYLHQVGLNEYNTPCRIDVIALVGDITQPQVTWLKNAF
jgi:putative endonuclease